MSAEPTYETQRIDHLGIVAGICQEISLIEQIDARVKSSNRKVSCGEGTQALILNALGFVGRALYLMPDYLRNKPVDVLIKKGLTAEDFNDDTLGRCLDDLHEAGITELFYAIAAHALEVYGLQPKFLHLDSSSFHLHGAYDPQEPEREAIEITYGYSKDHRSDLKQVVVQLITTHRSALPVWLEALSGNSNDRKTFAESVKAYLQQMKDKEGFYLVMDSAGFTKEMLKEAQEIKWITRVPETLALAKKAIQETRFEEMSALEAGYWGKEIQSEYAGFAQRWLVVFSEAAQQREMKTLEKARGKELESAQKEWRKFQERQFNCPEDAQAALSEFNQKWKYHRAEAQAKPVWQFARRGRPTANDQRQIAGYLLEGLVEVDENALAKAKNALGRFIIATNDLDASRLPAQALLDNYKDQGVTVERGFRFLKDPLFFAHSLFLKKPERIMALLMVMGLSLLIYALAEHKLRKMLQEMKGTLPNQRRKPTEKPTIRWVFQLFEGLDILLIRQSGQVILRKLLNLTPVQEQVIRLLGPQVEKCYLFSS